MARMTPDEWRKKKEEEKKQGTTSSVSTTPVSPSTTTSGVSSGRMTPSEWKAKKATTSADWWAKAGIGLLNEMQEKSKSFSFKDEYSSYSSRISDLLSQADKWRKQYAGNDEVISSINSIVDALSSARSAGFSRSNLLSKFKSEEEYNTAVANQQEYYSNWGHYTEDDPNFGISASKRDYANPTEDDLVYYDNMMDNRYWYTDANGVFRDVHGNEIYGDKISRPSGGGEITHPMANDEKYVINDPVGYYLSMDKDRREEMAYNGSTEDSKLLGPLLRKGTDQHWELLTEKDLNMYYYLLDTQGLDKAMEYIDHYAENRNAQWGAEWSEHIQSEENGFIRATAMGLLALEAGAESWSTGVGYALGGEIGPTSGIQYASNYTSESLDGFGKYAYDAAFTVGNMLPTILISQGVGSAAVGSLAMGVSAGGHAYAQGLNEGMTEGQAKNYGFLVGASEATLQYLIGGIGSLGGVADDVLLAKASLIDNALLRVSAKLGINIGSEIVEEELQLYLEPLFKTILTGEDYDAPTIDAMVETAIVTALSTFALEGGGTIATDVAESRQLIDKGRPIMSVNGGSNALLDLAYNVSGASNAKTQKSINKQAAKVKSRVESGNTKDSTARMVGKLYNTIGTETNAQNKADIVKALTRGENAFSTKKANAIAEAMVAKAKGYELTSSQSSLLDSVSNDARVQSAMDRIVRNDMSTMSHRNRQMEGFTNRVNFGLFEKAVTESVRQATTEKQFAPTGEYDVSDKGKAINTETDEEIDIKGVASIRKGELLLELSDGTTIDAKKVSFASESDALIYEAIAKLGDNINYEIANKLIGKYDGSKAEVFARGIAQAYTYGFYGIDRSEMTGEHSLATELTKEQRNYAYGLGEQYRAVKDQKDKGKARALKAPGEKGVYYRDKNGNATDIRSYLKQDGRVLNEMQTTAIEFMEKMSKMMGVRFNVFEGWEENGTRYYLDEDGVVQEGSPNGFYDKTTGEIYIDLFAGNDFQGTMLFTVAHELTHFMRQWSPEHFTKIAKLVFSHAGFKGSVSSLVADKMNTKRKYDYDTALEEVVADAMETILKDGKVAEFMVDVKKTDSKLWAKLKDWFKDLAEFLKKMVTAYSGQSAQTVEGQKVADFSKKLLNQIEQIWAEGAVAAGENYQVAKNNVGGEVDIDGDANKHLFSDKSIIEGAGLQFIPDEDGTHYKVLDANGKAVKEVTTEMIVDSPLGDLVTLAMENGFLGKGKTAIQAATKQYEFLADLVNMCIRYDGIAPIWETAGTMVFSSIKSNADKQYGLTIDFSTVCKKTQAIVDAMSEAMVRLGRGLTRSEVETIYLEVGKAGESTPCPVCYVFSRWMGIGGILDQINRFQEKYNGMSEAKLQSFISDVQERIKERANTPNSKGKLKSEFFDKNGAIKEGQVIADLKQKGNSRAASALNAIAKNSDTQLQIQELEVLMENQDAKEAKKTAKKIEKLKAKLVDVSQLESQYKQYNAEVEEYEAYQWLTRTLMKEENGKWVKNEAFKPVPPEVLFDLNNGATFAEEYPLSWAFRTGKGASAGKAITPYADARVGEAIQGIASQDVKSIKTGIDLNPFLNGDKKARQDIINKAIVKQARQNLIGGQRYQSTSDFRYEYGSDYLITFLEMQAIGAKVQLYTKVIEAVDFLASMGADINLSVMPLSNGFVTLPNGQKKLIYSSVTGIDKDAALAKVHEYDNVQLILVGISDEHIRLALEGEDVTFVIPFHGSGNTVHQIQVLMNLLGENLDVTTAQDYTAVQSDHVSPNQTKEQKALWNLRVKIITGKASTLSTSDQALLEDNAFLKDLHRRFYIDKSADEYGISLTSDQANQIFPYEYWDKSLTYAEADKNGERFKEYCASMGIIPRFSGKNSKGESVGFGDFTGDKGYWKLLIDRRMYDNTYDGNGNWTGYGKYHVQKRINCSDFQVKHLDPEYGSATYGDVMSKANDPKKTSAIVDRAIAQFENKGTLFSEQVSNQETDIDTDAVPGYDGGKKETEQEVNLYGQDGKAEDHASFIRRMHEGSRKIKQVRGIIFGYTPSRLLYASKTAEDAYRELKRLGIKCFLHKGLEYNFGGKTYSDLGEAGTLSDGSVAIYDKAFGDGIEYAGHEAFHVWKNSAEREAYVETLRRNISITSSVYGIEQADTVLREYFGGDVEALSSEESKAQFQEELYALVSGKIHSGTNEAGLKTMFKDYTAVKAAWDDLLKKQSASTTLYSERVTDKDTLDFLNEQLRNGEVTKVYRAMQAQPVDEDGNVIKATVLRVVSYSPLMVEAKTFGKNGKVAVYPAELFSPMAGVVNGKWSNSIALNAWERTTYDFANAYTVIDEKTGMPKIDNDKKNASYGEVAYYYGLVKGGIDDAGKKLTDVPARYNPYIHTSLSALNDQFSSAEKRPELVTVECLVPNSELTSGERAEGAKDRVGAMSWHSGPTSSRLAKVGKARTVILTRYDMPVRVVPDTEVAKAVADYIGDTENIAIKGSTVTPSLSRELMNLGISVLNEEQWAKYDKDFPTKTFGKKKKSTTRYSDRILMGSLFSGGGTLEAGLVYQMLDKEFAVEYKASLAATYADNHGKDHLFVGDVRDFDSKNKQNVFYLHASPVCKNFSPASHSGGETTNDITTAQATARVLEEQMPQVFTVENVKRYIGSEAYNIITDKLTKLGYKWDVDVYKASDYGNATKRDRMIIRAVKEGQLPAKPAKASSITSWGEATRDLWETDLIPSTLVKSKIEAIRNTPKLKNLKLTKLDKPLMIYDTNKSKQAIFAWADELAPTLTTKCGDARIIMPDGKVYEPTPKFMGRIQGLPDDYKYPKAKTNAFKIIGNGIPTQLTKAVIGGVLDSAYEQTHEGKTLYSDRDYVAYDSTAILKEETVDRWLREYATKSQPKYAQAYITYIRPDRFLDLTTSVGGRAYIESESRELDEADFADYTKDNPILLEIDHETGNVTGHEGRHRCVALQRAGITYVPVLLLDYSNKYDKQAMDSLELTGQVFANSRSYDQAYVYDILPLNYENREEVIKRFATQSSMQRTGERLGIRQTLRFQDRAEDSVSNRALLANAFEGIAKPEEKQKIQEYKDKISLIEAEEKKLREINEQIKELSFAKGPRDNKRIKALRFDAVQAANRINTYDKQLLRLEASEPLQKVLNREKKLAYKKAEQRGKEALADYKAKVEAQQKETTEKWRESRKTAVAKARETAEKRDARAKLQKLVLDTVKWISYPAKTDVKCPDILKKPYEAFLQGIDLSSKRLANGGEATKNDLRLANAMDSLATAIDKVMLSQDPSQDVDKVLDIGYLDLPADFVQQLRDMTESIKSMMVEGEYVVNTMTAAEVRKLSQMIRTLNHAIKTMSNLYANLRFANVEALGFDTMDFLDAVGEIEKTGGMKDFVQWDNALPYYAFKRFGKGGESIFEGLMDAQDKLAFLAQEIFDFQEKTWTGKEAKAWSEDTHTIALPNGNELTLTTADAMSIYCLSRREQALPHLLGGGVRVMGIQKGSQKAKDSRSLLTIEDVGAIISSLTDRQKQVAGAMQEYMSTVCSEWGNEISMKRFLTREFTEKFYFPIESNDENLTVKDPAAQQSDLFRLLNISATKPLTQGANNEVIVRNIFDVFVGHTSDMARLNAYGMGLLDYMKWLNYREKTTNEAGQINVKGVRKSMETAYGKAANSYVLNLIKDVNGRASDGGDPNILMKWMRAAKTASVGSSLRVATLQITSYPRAALVLSPKSLALGFTKVPNIRKAKKYCGIALWKSFGFYDTNIARSIEDQMKGVTDVKQKLIELSLKGAEWGDAITWGALWNACEYEVAKTTKNKVGSEEFYQEVGKKLREVVYRTQVVDSTLTRSQIMRSKRGMAQEAAAFMSEPTLSANILMDAGFEFNLEKRRTGSVKSAWKKTGSYIGRAVAVYSIGQLTAALLEAFWDAWRDDEDEEFGEKYWDAFVQNLILDLLPLNKLPILSDGVDMALAQFNLGFYSSDRMSTTWIAQADSALKAWKKVFEGESSTTVYNALYKTVRAISSFYGVSFSGVMREGVDLWNNFAGGYDSTLKIRQYDLSNASLGTELYEAIISGDTRQADSLKAQFDDEDAMHSAVRKALRENDPRIKEAAEARFSGDFAKYKELFLEIKEEGHFVFDDIMGAINAEVNELEKKANGNSTEETKETDEVEALFKVEHYYQAVVGNDEASAKLIYDDMIAQKIAEGYLRHEAEDAIAEGFATLVGKDYKDGKISSSRALQLLEDHTDKDESEVKKWDFELEHGFTWGSRVRKYRLGKLSEEDLISAVMDIEGESRETAEAYIDFLDLELAHGDIDITANDAEGYFKYAEPAGITIDVYLNYKAQAKQCKGIQDADGKTISGSKKTQLLDVINSLPITSAQKDALYIANGWAESKLYEAPWH